MGGFIEGSGGGTKVISANPRLIIPFNQTGVVAANLGTVPVVVPVMGVVSALPGQQIWPLQPGHIRYRFSGSGVFTSTGPGDVSIESAGMVADFVNSAGAPPVGKVTQMANSARLANLTALAENAVVSFDNWTLDVDDLKAMSPTAVGFSLSIILTLNNVGGAKTYSFIGAAQADIAQFSGYHFDKWE